jgi:GxxExxY protein
MNPEEDALTRAIIGLALGVHRDLGPALAEGLYHQLLCARLRRAGLEHLSKPRVPLLHRGMVVDTMESDLVIPRHLIVELKVLTGAFAGEHFAQIFSYMKLWGIETGLLMDFGKQELFLRRVSYRAPAPPVALSGGPAPTVAHLGARSAARLVVAGIDEVMREHGLGYRDTT